MRKVFRLCLLACVFPSHAVSAQSGCPGKFDVARYSDISKENVYENMPFQAGEKSTFEVTWLGLKVGYGHMEVRKPLRYRDSWHQVFHIDAKSGDWFRHIFVGHDIMTAFARPGDFAVSKFVMEQNEKAFLSRPFIQTKNLEFFHEDCKVIEKISKPNKEDKTNEVDLEPGALDAVGVIFELRRREFAIGKVERALVYTSQKNWWLEANPLSFEKVRVPAGEFETVKLKLQTYLGQELQQKGDLYVYFDRKTPERPLVKLEGEIKVGSVTMVLHRFQPGKNSEKKAKPPETPKKASQEPRVIRSY